METLDCKGLTCPMPMVELTKKIRKMRAGETLELISDDPHSREDIEAWCKRTGNELSSVSEVGTDLHYQIKKV